MIFISTGFAETCGKERTKKMARRMLARDLSTAARQMRYAPLASGEHDIPFLQKIVLEVASEHTSNIEHEEQVQITQIFGGITNQLFRCTFDGGDAETSCLLLRVFGGEGMIDRDVENATFERLAAAGIGVPYHGRFANGRVEGWLAESEALTLDEMPLVSTKVAVEMAKLHRFSPPCTENEKNADTAGSTLWAQLWSWLRQAQEKTREIEDRHGAQVAERFDALHTSLLGSKASSRTTKEGEVQRVWKLERVEAELLELESSMPFSPVVFCHNDILAGNVMLDKQTGHVTLIDFEYGGLNFRGADIANHWNEWAGGTQAEMNGVCEYERFPSDEEQRRFCKAYLVETQGDRDRDNGLKEELKEGNADEEMKVDLLVAEANAFVQVNHWYWGLWAVNQAVLEGVDEFDYITYAESRAKRYWATKNG
jgi:thiamine kinase-like enzyme